MNTMVDVKVSDQIKILDCPFCQNPLEGNLNNCSYCEDVRYFNYRLDAVQTFMSRFPKGIDFKGKNVLDLGSGHGALSIIAALEGASQVRGIDLNGRLVEFADQLKRLNFSEVQTNISFEKCDINDLDDMRYDVIVSQATFEHILDPLKCLKGIRERLSDGGKFYLGFGPLYNAPWGDHRRTKAPLQTIFPWSHLSFSRDWLVNHYNQKTPQSPIKRIEDLGINGLSFKDYMDAFNQSGMTIKFLKVNNSKNPVSKVLNTLRKVPPLEEFLSVNIYAVFEK